MVRIPPINSDVTMRRKESSVLQQIGIALFLDLIETKKEAYFLDVDMGTNPFGALAFRLANGANDTVNFFMGEPLAPTPTVQEIIDNPTQHFQRLMIGTNLDVRRAVAASPQQESEINSGLQRRRSQGESLVQVIANAVNADKDTRRAFDSYLIRARDFAIEQAEAAAERAVGGLDENIGRLVSGLADFVIDAAFATPRRSGDGKRVSKEQHEYNYLSNEIIQAYGNTQFGITLDEGWTHMQVALQLLRLNFNRAQDEQPGLQLGGDPDFEGIEDIVNGPFFDLDNDLFFHSRFSYGDFIDSYHMRRLLAELKKLVQGTRVDNVSEFLRRSGTTREEFLNNQLHRLSPTGFISLAANEFILNNFANPTRPVRTFVDQREAVQPFIPEGEDTPSVPEGPLLRFAQQLRRAPAGQNQNLEPVEDREQ